MEDLTDTQNKTDLLKNTYKSFIARGKTCSQSLGNLLLFLIFGYVYKCSAMIEL